MEKEEDRKWFAQGSHDGLCGFYAVLNALWDLGGYELKLDNKIDPKDRDDRYRLDYAFANAARHERAYFDEAVEVLTRVGGVTMLALRSHPTIGGLDAWQLEELVTRLNDRWGLGVNVERIEKRTEGDSPLSEIVRDYSNRYEDFAIIGSIDRGGHWVTLLTKKGGGYKTVEPGSGIEKDFKPTRSASVAHKSGLIIWKPIPSDQ